MGPNAPSIQSTFYGDKQMQTTSSEDKKSIKPEIIQLALLRKRTNLFVTKGDDTIVCYVTGSSSSLA